MFFNALKLGMVVRKAKNKKYYYTFEDSEF